MERQDRWIPACLALLIFSCIIFFSWFALREFNQGLCDGFDQGVYRQITWATLHGKLLWCSFMGQSGLSDLTMHANLGLLILLPLFKFFNSPVTFLFMNAFFLGIAALPVYLIAKEKINRRAGMLFAIFYLTNTFTIQALIEGFQTRSLSVPIYFLAFYLLIKKRYLGFNLTLVLLCLTHEVNCLVVFMLGIYVIFLHRRFMHGLVISFLSLGWFILVVKVLFPYFGNPFPLEALNFTVGEKLFSNAGEIVSYCFLHPVAIAQRCLSQAKLDYLLRLFLPLGFLSLASPVELLIGFPIFLQNVVLSQDLISVEVPRYTMALLPAIFISAIYSAAYLSKKLRFQWKYLEAVVIVCWLLAGYRFILDPQYNPRFTQVLSAISKETVVHREALQRITQMVPSNASVSADIKAFPFLSNRFELYDIPLHVAEAEYILIDKKQPKISPKAQELGKEYLNIIDRLLTSARYRLVGNLDGIILLKKGK